MILVKIEIGFWNMTDEERERRGITPIGENDKLSCRSTYEPRE